MPTPDAVAGLCEQLRIAAPYARTDASREALLAAAALIEAGQLLVEDGETPAHIGVDRGAKFRCRFCGVIQSRPLRHVNGCPLKAWTAALDRTRRGKGE
jgi:hypothetical protein